MVVNSDKSPLQLAIMFNAKHLNWSTTWRLIWKEKSKVTNNFMKAYPEFELKAAIQLIKGKHSTKDFKEGTLKISNEEYMEATKKAGALYLINTKVVFRRDIVVAFYRVWDKIPNIQTYIKRLGSFKMPLTESRKEWERAYEDLLR